MNKMIRNVAKDTSCRLESQRKAMRVRSAAVMLRYFVRQFEVHLRESGKAEMKITVGRYLFGSNSIPAGDVAVFKMIRGLDEDTSERFAAYARLMGKLTQAQLLRYFVLQFGEHLRNTTDADRGKLREIVESYISEERE